MKKLLIILSPIWAVLFVLVWILWGLEGVFTFFGIVLLIVAFVFGLSKWIDFVDKHIKD